MSELASEENERTVARVYQAAMEALHVGRPISPAQRVVHDIEHLMQEANSDASFEQYFRWASPDELAGIRDRLRGVGLDDIASLVSRAVEVAFPRGLPGSEAEQSEATAWSPEQEQALAELFGELESENGRVMNVLGAYAREHGA